MLVETKLQYIAEKAREDSAPIFTNLYHVLNVDLFRLCFNELRGNAAVGIDKVTKAQYEVHLEQNLQNLADRVQRMGYKPLPVRRIYIPKVGSSKMRPLGIPALEDKIVQLGLVKLLQGIYEEDFIDNSYGFRPGRSCHDALRELNRVVESQQTNYIVEADIKGFFDNVEHEWMIKFMEHRIKDSRVLRLINRFLKAGVMEDGVLSVSEKGTPQGGIISPLLANIYLHYALDIWFENRYKRISCRGAASIIRYADDFVVCFKYEDDARHFEEALGNRLAEFGLEVEPSKTKTLAFGPIALAKAKREGTKPETFDFLGFTHYCSISRKGGRFRMKRKTSRKKFKAKIKAFKEWLKSARTLPTKDIMRLTKAKLTGHFAYYGITDNYEGIASFARKAERLLYKWLNRRGRRKSMNWEKLSQLLTRNAFPTPRIKVSIY